MTLSKFKYCFIIPHYNHERQFLKFLPQVLKTNLPCIVVDDGSAVESVGQLKTNLASKPNVYMVEHGVNRGKGAAVKTGFTFARSLGFTHIIQIDADGQHDVSDVERFVSASQEKPSAFVCGKPTFDTSAPKVRLYGRKVTDFWVALESLSTRIKDGLCGFRIYPLTETEQVLDAYFVGSRMDFDTEILVKASWLDIELQFIETAVVYPENSVSHFNYLRDNLLLIKLHVRLVAGMLLRLPWILLRRLRRRRP